MKTIHTLYSTYSIPRRDRVGAATLDGLLL